MIELNKIYNIDALEGIKQIPDKSIQLVLTDPPFYKLNKAWDRGQFKNKEEYINWCVSWFKECYRVLKDDGAFYTFCDWELCAELIIELKEIFPHFQNFITWNRIKGRSSSINFKNTREEILYFSKVKLPKFNEQKMLRPVIAPYKNEEGKPKGWFIDEKGNRVRWTGCGNIFYYTPPVWSSIEEPPQHSCQKPLLMLQRIISASSDENDTVLDLFIGSGSTMVAAKKLKRNYIGFEFNIEDFNKAQERLNKYD